MLRLFQGIKQRVVQRTPARPRLTVPNGAVVELQSGQICTLRAVAGWRLRVESGSLWVTQADDQVDHYLTDTAPLVLCKRGLVVIECLGSSTARFRVEPEMAPDPVPKLALVRVRAPRPETGRPQTRPDGPRLAAPWRDPSSA